MENLKSSQIPQGQAVDEVPTVTQEPKVDQLSNSTTKTATNALKLPTPLPPALPTKPA